MSAGMKALTDILDSYTEEKEDHKRAKAEKKRLDKLSRDALKQEIEHHRERYNELCKRWYKLHGISDLTR